MELDVVEVQVKDWRGALAWWEKLGLKVVVREDDDQFALLRGNGGSMVGVFGRKKPTKQGFLPYFRVQNIDSMVVSFKKKGVAVGHIEEQHWGRQSKITDPEGHVIYVFEEK